MRGDRDRYEGTTSRTELFESRNCSRRLSRRLIEAQEEERLHVGKELHDDICQSLAVLGYELDRLLDTLPAEAQSRIREISERIRQLTSHINRLSNQLHSLTLKDLGLPVALRSLCAELADNDEIQVQCRCSPVSADLDGRVALTLFRTAQEAVRNIHQHSHAQHACVELMSNGNEILLRISDDGVGFDPVAARFGNTVGLASAEARLQSLGGALLVRSAHGSGTVLEARSPLATHPVVARDVSSSAHE